MSLIYTCRLCAANPLDYLYTLQRHAKEALEHPNVRPAGWVCSNTLQARSQALFARDLSNRPIRTGKAQVLLYIAAADILRPSANAVPTEALIEQISLELLSLAAAGLVKGRSSPQANPSLALVLKYKLLPKTQDTGNDSLLQLSLADLQPLFDDLAQRLVLGRAMTQPTTAAIPRPGA